MVTHDGHHFDNAALALALQLESEGHTLRASNGQLLVTNKATLTAEQIAAIRQHRLMLLGICGYETARVIPC